MKHQVHFEGNDRTSGQMAGMEYSLGLYGKPKYNQSKDAPCLICGRRQMGKKWTISRIKAAAGSEEEKKEKEGEENKPNSTSD